VLRIRLTLLFSLREYDKERWANIGNIYICQMKWKELIEKFERIKILHQKFRKTIKQTETNQLQIKPAHDTNTDILDQLKKSQIQVTQYQKVITQMTVVLIILGVVTLFVGVHELFQTDKQNTIAVQIELLKEQLQDNTSMLLQQSKALDSLHYQVRTLAQKNERLTKIQDTLDSK